MVKLTVGGDRLIADPRRSCGPILLWRRIGRPAPGVPPGDDAHDGAMRIFGVINVLSDKRRFGNAFATRRKLLSGDDGELPNHQEPSTPPVPEPTFQNFMKYHHGYTQRERKSEKEIKVTWLNSSTMYWIGFQLTFKYISNM